MAEALQCKNSVSSVNAFGGLRARIDKIIETHPP